MTDAYLLESSVQRMTTLGVIEALSITAQFGMGALGLQYADELARRLSTESFVQVRGAIQKGAFSGTGGLVSIKIGFYLYEFCCCRHYTGVSSSSGHLLARQVCRFWGGQ